MGKESRAYKLRKLKGSHDKILATAQGIQKEQKYRKIAEKLNLKIPDGKIIVPPSR